MDNQQTQALKPKTDYTMDSSERQTRQVDEQGSTGGSDGTGDKLSSAVGGNTESSGDGQGFLDKGKQWSLWGSISTHANDAFIRRY